MLDLLDFIALSENFIFQFSDNKQTIKSSNTFLEIIKKSHNSIQFKETIYESSSSPQQIDYKQWVFYKDFLELWRIQPEGEKKIFTFSFVSKQCLKSNFYSCGKDTYHASIFLEPSSWTLEVNITGPKKQVLLTNIYLIFS